MTFVIQTKTHKTRKKLFCNKDDLSSVIFALGGQEYLPIGSNDGNLSPTEER